LTAGTITLVATHADFPAYVFVRLPTILRSSIAAHADYTYYKNIGILEYVATVAAAAAPPDINTTAILPYKPGADQTIDVYIQFIDITGVRYDPASGGAIRQI
jgi:hypothetical protein